VSLGMLLIGIFDTGQHLWNVPTLSSMTSALKTCSLMETALNMVI